MPKIKSFEEHSDAYDAWFHKNSALYKAELETIRLLMPAPETEGMEVGVGSGKFAAPLGIKLGVEPSPRMAEKARARGIDVYHGVAEQLPFSDDKFDFVLMVTTICFVDDIARAFKEAFRVLKPDGRIIVGFVDKASTLGQQYMDKREKSKFYKEATFFSASQVLKHLAAADFCIALIKQTLIPGEPQGTILDGFGKGAFVAIKGVKDKMHARNQHL